jgi:transcriptional regulator with XRE-family HTH domain
MTSAPHLIGATLRDRRERLGLFQRQVAERAGLSARHYRRIENGLPSTRRTLLQIAAVLDTTVEEMDALTADGDAA